MLTFLSDVHCINSSTRAITYNDAHSETRSRKIRETKQRKKKPVWKIRTTRQERRLLLNTIENENTSVHSQNSSSKMRHQSFCCSHWIIKLT